MRPPNLFRLIAPLFFLPLPSPASPHFTLPQILSSSFASSPLASPIGAKVAWLENKEGRRNIWLASAPDWSPKQLTSYNEDDGQEIGELCWSPDGTFLIYVRGGDFENGGENPNPALTPERPEQAIYRIAFDGAPPKKLALGHAPKISPHGDSVAFIRDGQIFTVDCDGNKSTPLIASKGKQEDLLWAPDGHALAFTSVRDDHSFIGVYDLAAKELRFLDPSTDRDIAAAWSPDSQQIAHIRIPAATHPAFFGPARSGEPWSIRIVTAASGKGTEVFRANAGRGSLFHPLDGDRQLFWMTGNRLVFPYEQTGWNHLYSLSLPTPEVQDLTPGDGEVEHVTLSANRDALFCSGNWIDINRRHIWRLDAGGDRKQLTTGDSIEWAPTPVADGSAVLLLQSSFNRKSHAAVLLAGASAPKSLASPASDGFPASALVQPQPVDITAADGLAIHGQLFLPPAGTPGTRHPALIFFHGGSRRQMLLGFHYMYYYSNAYAMNQYLASRGYVVLSVNYRSGIGYGLNFREAIDYGARGGSEFNDVIGAGLFLKARPDVDGARIGVWGGSYGGYLTAMALAKASDLFSAGVDFHGVHDWSTLYGYLTRSGGQSGDPAEVHDRQKAAEIAFQSSPMAYVDNWRSPVLLIHGDDDRNVEFSQTVVLAEALRKRKVPFEELIFPNEIHDFLLHRDWVAAYEATADFFARKLR